MTNHLSSADIATFLLEISKFCYIKKLDTDSILKISNSFHFSWVFKDFLNKNGYNFDDVSRPTPGLLEIKVFWNKGYDVIVSVQDVTSKILSGVPNYIVDVVIWPKFGNSSIAITEVIISLILYRFDHKNCFFEEWSWFKLNNLGLALGTSLEFYMSLAQGLKVKVRKFWLLIPTFVEVTVEKLVGGHFPSPSWIGLKIHIWYD